MRSALRPLAPPASASQSARACTPCRQAESCSCRSKAAVRVALGIQVVLFLWSTARPRAFSFRCRALAHEKIDLRSCCYIERHTNDATVIVYDDAYVDVRGLARTGPNDVPRGAAGRAQRGGGRVSSRGWAPRGPVATLHRPRHSLVINWPLRATPRAVHKSKYYRSRPRISRLCQIEVQRKVEVG